MNRHLSACLLPRSNLAGAPLLPRASASPSGPPATPERARRTRGARLLLLSSLALSLAFLLGCEPEVGMPCSANTAYVGSRVVQEEGRNDLVRDINFENCTQLLCLSSNGSRPYCTRSCETDLDCGAEGFRCQQAVNFGPLACEGEDPNRTCVEPNGEPSPNPIFYCVAEAGVIEARDEQFGREEQSEEKDAE